MEKWKKTWPHLLALFFLCCSLCSAQASAASEVDDRHWVEPTAWKTIYWQPDARSAIREATLSGKPIMVFLFVNYKGRADAGKA